MGFRDNREQGSGIVVELLVWNEVYHSRSQRDKICCITWWNPVNKSLSTKIDTTISTITRLSEDLEPTSDERAAAKIQEWITSQGRRTSSISSSWLARDTNEADVSNGRINTQPSHPHHRGQWSIWTTSLQASPRKRHRSFDHNSRLQKPQQALRNLTTHSLTSHSPQRFL